MKKSIPVLLALFILIVASCKKETSKPADIVGKWARLSITDSLFDNGTFTGIENYSNTTPGLADTLIFYPDGKSGYDYTFGSFTYNNAGFTIGSKSTLFRYFFYVYKTTLTLRIPDPMGTYVEYQYYVKEQ